MASVSFPSVRRIEASNVLPIAPGFNEPASRISKDVLKPEESFGGNIRRILLGSQNFPANNNDVLSTAANPGAGVVFPGGTSVYFLDFAPGFTTPMHRTSSVDFIVVQKGSPTLITPASAYDLVDGEPTSREVEETICQEGEVVIQRGQMHAWSNRTDSWVRVLCFIVDAAVQKTAVAWDGKIKALDETWTKWVPTV